MIAVGDRVRARDLDIERGGACGRVVSVEADPRGVADPVLVVELDNGKWAAVPIEWAEPLVVQ